MEEHFDRPPRRNIIQLAEKIHESTNKISEFLQQSGLPGPSLHPNAPSTLGLSPDAQVRLDEVLAAMDELSSLLLGPLGWLKLQYNLVNLHALYRFNVPSLLPVGQDTPMQDVAAACGINNDTLCRMLQHAVSNYMLVQTRPGYVSYSACSAMLLQSPDLMRWVGSACEDLWPTASQIIPALEKWPGQSSLETQTAFNMARTERFARAMGLMQSMPGFEPLVLLDVYYWASLGLATVVDVGGSQSAIGYSLKKQFPTLRVIVQDLPEVPATTKAPLAAGGAEEGSDLADVSPQSHGMFTTQTLQGAEVYLFRLVLHDWPDNLCLTILRQLIPALEPGAKTLINDLIIPSAGSLPPYHDRQIRCQDLAMLALFTSKERSNEQWRELITNTDSRFETNSFVRIPNSPLGLIEVVWNGRE
ncbi:S-adenosyl-L-methionine-dependent methyltransferase [Xylariaceae sp. FL1651]|nr:S-adenosyl-L-methionine-dependent methyltransferase [Xylariaceae sp. FL1651]